MINPAKKLQDSIIINGIEYKIDTNFRKWLRFEQQTLMNQLFLPSYLFIGKKPPMFTTDVRNALLDFLHPVNVYPRPSLKKDGHKDIDMLNDWDYIYSSFYREYGINLSTVQLHYHEFLALFKGLFLKYNDVITIRNYDGKDSKLMEQSLRWRIMEEPEIDPEQQAFNEKIERQYRERLKKQQGSD